MKAFQIRGNGGERPRAMHHQMQSLKSSKSRRSHPALNQERGAIWRQAPTVNSAIWTRRTSPRTLAVITTKYPLAPALARQQTAKMVAVITTKFPLAPALAKQQTAKMVAVIRTKFPLAPALARQQTAEMVLATGPHLGGLGNDCGGGRMRTMRTSTHSATKSTHRQQSGPRT